jgi:transcriptional regulator of acetoin/glycerol metabolism
MNFEAMSSGTGTTTVTEASSHRPAAAGDGLGLLWLFPRPGQPAVTLGGASARALILGRDAAADVVLEGNDVSRRHAIVEWSGPTSAITIKDLGSRNGVRVNGRSVPSATLAAGDIVRVGGWIGVVTGAPGALAEIAPGLYGGGALQAALAPLRKAAASELSIVLEGETGTGKEIVARALHAWSGRKGPLVAVNCAALPEGLAEGELFGYRRGAFTGADRASPGFFRSAEGGTLLLDEVSDLPLALQAKLLRALEEHEVQPLGETRPVAVDVRIVVACQQPLADAVREGRFRADLLARLDGLTVRLPALRKRREDVLPLFSRLLADASPKGAPALDADFVERLCAHDWPYNVRELVQLVRRLIVLRGDESTLRAEHLPERIGVPVVAPPLPASATLSPAPAAPVPAPAEPLELPALVAALRTSGGNVARAAALLGITRQRAYRLMEGQSVDLEALRNPEPGAR